MTENSTALLFDILDTATQGDPDSAANNIALLNQLLSATYLEIYERNRI